VIFTNTPERVVELTSAIDRALAVGVSPAELASFRGRLGFAEGQTFGRLAAPALAALSGSDTRLAHGLGPDLPLALSWLRSYLQRCPPRVVPACLKETTLVFTDGACEPELCSCGAVLLQPATRSYLWFSFVFPPSVTGIWRREGQEQLIAQAELAPVLLARLTWKHLLQEKAVIYFVDNEGVREALVKGSTKSVGSRRLLFQTAEAGVELGGFPWYSRVASPSNVADAPSRLRPPEVILDFPAREVVPILPEDW
jgi:hypothetical protein